MKKTGILAFGVMLSGLLASLPAWAQAGAAGRPEGSLMSLLPMLVIFVLVFYFLLVRPQSKRAKEQRQLMAGLTEGDEVLTTGGIAGEIEKIEDNFVKLKVAENAKIVVQKAAISTVLPKGTLKSL